MWKNLQRDRTGMKTGNLRASCPGEDFPAFRLSYTVECADIPAGNEFCLHTHFSLYEKHEIRMVPHYFHGDTLWKTQIRMVPHYFHWAPRWAGNSKLCMKNLEISKISCNYKWNVGNYLEFPDFSKRSLEIQNFTWKSWNFKICKWNVDIFSLEFTPRSLEIQKIAWKILEISKCAWNLDFSSAWKFKIYMK